MGWTCEYNHEKQSMRDYFTPKFNKEGYKLLDIASTLTVSYIALQYPDGHIGALVILTKHIRGEEFCYKDMSEDMGPLESQCPERILKLLSPTTDEHALAWRARCYAALDKKKHAAKPGDVIRFTEPLTFTDHSSHDMFKIIQHKRVTYFQVWPIEHPELSLYHISDWKTRNYSVVRDE